MTVAAPKKTTSKKSTRSKAKASTAKRKTTSKQVVKRHDQVKTLRLAPSESQTFLVVSTDFDGDKNRVLQVFASIILLGVFATTIYMAILTNQIAQTILFYV